MITTLQAVIYTVIIIFVLICCLFISCLKHFLNPFAWLHCHWNVTKFCILDTNTHRRLRETHIQVMMKSRQISVFTDNLSATCVYWRLKSQISIYAAVIRRGEALVCWGFACLWVTGCTYSLSSHWSCGWIVAERSGWRWGEEFTDRTAVKMEKINKKDLAHKYPPVVQPSEFWNKSREMWWINEKVIVLSKCDEWRQPPEAGPNCLDGG